MKDRERHKDKPSPADQVDQATEATPPEDNSVAEEKSPEFLLRTLESVRKERDEYYDLLLRKQAEFENFRKRTLKDREEARLAALTDISKELLPVIDAAEKGLASLGDTSSDPRLRTYREGYLLLIRNLRAVLEKFGVTELPSVGEKFDPSVHEAVATEVTDEQEEGHILEEFRKGYLISNRLLRPAQVKVATPGQRPPEGEAE
jgi:molecular chaperone GrpE